MPEITVIHTSLLVAALILGVILGWIVRGGRSKNEKMAINAGWQEQFEAKRSEHERLLDQNKSLMEQNSQFQASNKDSKMRATELSDALKEAFERRDELQRQIKDIRGNLEAAVTQRDQLQIDIQGRNAEHDATSTAIKRRDEKIAKLSKDLAGWQDRVPPLIEQFRARNAEALQLRNDLATAHERIAAIQAMVGSDQTRVEPVDPDALTDGLDASNDPIDETGVLDRDDTDESLAALEAEVDEVESFIDSDEFKTLVDAVASDVYADSQRDENGDDVAREQEDSYVDADENATADQSDDLKRIKGIGPAIEKTLNEMGIWRFDQLAAMSEYDIDRVANRLKGFRSRIYREDWVGQARDLHDQKLDDQP